MARYCCRHLPVTTTLVYELVCSGTCKSIFFSSYCIYHFTLIESIDMEERYADMEDMYSELHCIVLSC